LSKDMPGGSTGDLRIDEVEKLDPGEVHVAELLVGVLVNRNEITDPDDHYNSSIFESFFDLTHARLQHIFKMFDDLSKDHSKGVLSYENFRSGLKDAGLEIKDKDSFDRLVKKVDLDKDGGISFSEFETVVQSLKMAHMFKNEPALTENRFSKVVNYNTTRCNMESIDPVSLKAFMFNPRPQWATRRWIDVRIPATFMLKCLAIKHRLHPLALEDVLKNSLRTRAKVDRYDTHLFVAFPVLELVFSGGSDQEYRRRALERSSSMRNRGKNLPMRRVSSSTSKGAYGSFDTGLSDPLIKVNPPSPISKRYQSGSVTGITVPKVVKTNAYIFVTTPDCKTILTCLNNHEGDIFHRVRQELNVAYSRLRTHDVMYLLYSIIDIIVDTYNPLMEELEFLLEALSEQVRQGRASVLHGPDEKAFSSSYNDLLRELGAFKRWIVPAQRVIANLIADDNVDKNCKFYFQDIHDHLDQILDEIGSLNAGVQTLKAEHDHAIEVKMNGTMNALTIVATAFIPAQFLTGVFGMNFTNMPELQWKYGYGLFWFLTVGSWFVLFSYFKQKGYIDFGSPF